MKTVHLSLLLLLTGLIVSPGYSALAADKAVSDDGSKTEQSRPRIAVSANHGFVIVWEDKRGGMPDVYFQRFDQWGYPTGINRRITDDTGPIVHKQPVVAGDHLGGYRLSWLDYRTGSFPFAPQIFSQRLDSLGNLLGVNTRLTGEPPDSLRAAPDVALSANGEGLLVWEDYRNRNWDIYAQRISSAGTLVGGNFKISDDMNNAQQHSPRVAVSPDGWFVVTWYDNRWGNDDIFVQRLDSTAGNVGQNIKVNSDAGGSRQAFPDVAADGVGHFTVVWTDWRNGTYPNNPDIYARKYDTAMTALTSDTKVNRDGSSRAQKDPAISADRLGNVAIVWSDSGASSFDITGQMVDVDGKIRETSFKGNFFKDSAQMQPDVALDGRMRYICWADNRNGNWDIFASITQYNDPTLVATPSALNFLLEIGKPMPEPKAVIIDHTGYNRLQYRAKSSAAWLAVAVDTGTTLDTISVSISDSSLPAGTYAGTVTLVDLTNSDSSVAIPVVLVCRQPNDDTLRIGSGQVSAGQSTSVDMVATNADSLSEIALSLKSSAEVMTIDSVTIDSSLPPGAMASFTVDSTTGNAALAFAFDSTAYLAPGAHTVGRIWVTGVTAGYAAIDSAGTVTFTTVAGQVCSPVFQSGELVVDEATAIEEDIENPLPTEFALAQNYPNPFNGSTVIAFDVPVAGQLSLEIYNVLGQRVATLIDGKVASGRQQVYWSGQSDRGTALPSGIYFYRLQDGIVSLVRKLVLLK